MLKPAFIDLSHHNTVPRSLLGTAASGIVGVIHKMTEGVSFTDDKVDNRYFLTRQAGMLWGLYHFIRPGRIVEQVQYFVRRSHEVQVTDDETLYCLDWEDKGVSANDALTFLQTLEQMTKRPPVLYSGHVLKEDPDPRLKAYRLWLAQYAAAPVLPQGWTKWWGWQYTEAGTVPGVQPFTDLNAYQGTADELRRDWVGAAVEPPVSEHVVKVIAPKGVRVEVEYET